MEATRRTAAVTGALFLVTEVTAIAGLALYRPALDGAAYVTGTGADQRVLLGALCEMVLLLAVVGTGVSLFPVLRRRDEALALGYACGRLLEAAVIAVGIVGMLAVVTLRWKATDAGSGDGAAFEAAATALTAIHDWTFLLGPNVVLGANTLVLAYAMHRSGLVPRPLTLLGLVGGTAICASAVAVLFGIYPQVSVAGSAAALPVFAWEVILAVRLLTRGFEPVAPAPASA
ncbi:DUF4386 domain-containing protein, partial [Streptomyces sp. NRRL S-118]|uniref:DUF4386 domain-containing protein n=1 Tax=Streptomyces sp. NRRL S-118 TaxID=1463881 RepID=UPI0004C4E75D